MARCNFVDEDGESCEKKARRSADFPHRCNRHQFDDDEPAELSSPKLKGILKSPPPTPTAPPLENAASRPTTPNSRQSAPWLASVSVDEDSSPDEASPTFRRSKSFADPISLRSPLFQASPLLPTSSLFHAPPAAAATEHKPSSKLNHGPAARGDIDERLEAHTASVEAAVKNQLREYDKLIAMGLNKRDEVIKALQKENAELKTRVAATGQNVVSLDLLVQKQERDGAKMKRDMEAMSRRLERLAV